jgi:hypothetical protein
LSSWTGSAEGHTRRWCALRSSTSSSQHLHQSREFFVLHWIFGWTLELSENCFLECICFISSVIQTIVPIVRVACRDTNGEKFHIRICRYFVKQFQQSTKT